MDILKYQYRRFYLALAYYVLPLIFLGCSSSSPQITINVRISDNEICFASDTLFVIEPSDSIDYDIEPSVTRRVEPVYPHIALRNNLTGEVYIKAWITKTGYVRRGRIIKTTNELFNKSALRAIIGWQFTPVEKDGKAIDVWAIVPFLFRMPDKEMSPPTQQLPTRK